MVNCHRINRRTAKTREVGLRAVGVDGGRI